VRTLAGKMYLAIRPHILAAGLLVTAFAGPLGAQEAAPYRVGEGDVLNVSIFDNEALSGSFRVGADGAIGYPLLGHLEIAGMSVRDVEQLLGDRIAQLVPLSSVPTVVVEEYAPVYVVGDIDKSGPYEYRPGMIALELVALAGGMRRAAAGENGVTGLIAAEQRLTALRLSKLALLVRRTRLEAEADGGVPDFDTIPEGLVSPHDRTRIVDNEMALFEVRRKLMDGQRDALAAQRTTFDAEISALEQMIALQTNEIGWMDEEIRKQQDLFDRGLSVQSRLLELKREASSDRRDLLQAQSYLARARQQQLAIDQRLQEVADTRAREVAEAMSAADTELVRLDDDLSAAWQTIDELRRQLKDPALAQPSPPELTIIRMQDGKRISIPADRFSAILPRDILQIEVAKPPAVGRQSSTAG
jgi:polysaccharide export outer membrane protein